jgi:hypothetical protein
MGREIRRVPPNWEHPKKDFPNHRLGRMEMKYQPLRDRPFGPAMDEWYAAWKKWEAGDRDGCDDPNMTFWEWGNGPPDPEYYRPAWDESTAAWYQVYETVSEGTPVTPPFATKEELIDYLVNHGDFWDQSRVADGRHPAPAGWSRIDAEAFVKNEWAPSMEVRISNGQVKILEPRDGI